MKEGKKKPVHPVGANLVWSARMLLSYSPSAFVILILLVPVHVGMQYLEIWLPALVVSEVTARQPIVHALFRVGLVMAAMMVGDILNKTLTYIGSSRLGIYRKRLTELLARKNMELFYQTYERKSVRDLGSRAQTASELWNGSQPLSDLVKNGFGILENLLGYLLFGTVISFVSPWLIPLLTIGPAVNLLSVRAYHRWEYAHREKMTDLNRKLDFVESLPGDFAGAKDIRIYGMASWLRECYRDLSLKRGRWDRQMIWRDFLSRTAGLLVILIRDGGAYWLLISMVRRGELSVDQFILYFAAVSAFADWVGGIMECWNQLQRVSLLVCDFREYIDYPDPDGSGRARLADYLGSAPEIVFDRVCFRYEGNHEDTIHDLSFTLHRGERLALVGENGAGKTTIVKLLCGLYAPTSGEIRINGTPQSQFRRKDYYRLIAPVFQDIRTAFFSLAGTVSGRSLEDTDMERAERCLRQAGLGQKLDGLEQGMNTRLNKQVNKNGTELSGGEAQKLMLARALYKDAPALVLDEPTAALDPIAESRIYGEYSRMAQHKTSLFISHRLASTSFCDRILLLEHGRIREEGTHRELLELGGAYRELFEMQSCWYKEESGQ